MLVRSNEMKGVDGCCVMLMFSGLFFRRLFECCTPFVGVANVEKETLTVDSLRIMEFIVYEMKGVYRL